MVIAYHIIVNWEDKQYLYICKGRDKKQPKIYSFQVRIQLKEFTIIMSSIFDYSNPKNLADKAIFTFLAKQMCIIPFFTHISI